MYRKYILIVMLGLLPFYLCAKSIKLASTQWPPYSSKYLNNGGFATAIVSSAFKAVGYEVKVEFLPWARVLAITEQGQVDGMFPSYYVSQREGYVSYSKPFASSPIVFFKKKSRDIQFENFNDLKPYYIGVVRGYHNSDEFDAREDMMKKEADNDKENFSWLIKDRLDLVIADKWVGYDILENSFPIHGDSIDSLSKIIDEKELFVAFSQKADNYKQKLEDFNKGLKIIKDNGLYDEIMKGFVTY